jgi:hypothetical protein
MSLNYLPVWPMQVSPVASKKKNPHRIPVRVTSAETLSLKFITLKRNTALRVVRQFALLDRNIEFYMTGTSQLLSLG